MALTAPSIRIHVAESALKSKGSFRKSLSNAIRSYLLPKTDAINTSKIELAAHYYLKCARCYIDNPLYFRVIPTE